MKRYLLVLMAAMMCSMSAWAVMATPELIVKKQADGSEVQLKLVGDEFHSYYTLVDGTPVSLNKNGMWVKDASVVTPSTSARKARRVAQEKQFSATFPLSGSPHSVVILVNFSDQKFTYKREAFENMLNVSGYSENGGVGSARDYFIASSDSVFSPYFDCYGPVTLSNKSEYYDKYTSRMIVEACNKVADEYGVNFAQYDTNNDGRLDNVFVYYAGHNEAEGAASTTIWPHRSVVQTGDRVSGKLIYDYACTSELRGSAGSSMCGIGTFCHEFGHVLGLPDYYDTDDQYSQQYTIGSWDIMCSGSYNGNGKTPPSYTAGERFQLGWVTPVQLHDAGVYTLEPIENGSKQIYMIANDTHNLSWESANPNEYWLLENRQNVGWDRHATSLPGTGMLIWHVDYNASAWGNNSPNNGTPLRYDIEEAGGAKGYATASDPFPGSRNITSFTPTLHNGTIVEQPIADIAVSGENIMFTFKSQGLFMFVPAELDVLQSTYNSTTGKSNAPGSKLRIAGEHLDPNQDIVISATGTGFTISEDSVKWNKSLTTRANADSTLEYDVFVRFAPTHQVCDIQRGTLTVKQDTKSGSLLLKGTSPRPVLIETPYINKMYEQTPTTFKVQWDPVLDAEQFYVTLYHMEEGIESKMESFEGFDEEAVVQEAGWATSFYRTTTRAKEDGAESMWFKENNEWMISPIYPLPVVKLSMWLTAPATTDSEVGIFYLTGYSDTGIDTLDIIRVLKSTKQYTYTKEFTEDQGYRRFRLDYTSIGGEGVCMDAFTTTFNQKTIYTYKGREMTIAAQNDSTMEFYAYDLTPNFDQVVVMPDLKFDGKEATIDEFTYSEQAAVAAADLSLQTQVITKVLTLENGKLDKTNSKSFKIIGDIKDFNGKKGENQYYIQFTNKDESKSNIACSIEDVQSQKYTFECTPINNVDGTLYLAEIFDPYTNNSIILNITDEDDTINYNVGVPSTTSSPNPTTTPNNATTKRTNPATYRKNSSGLSGGAIAGIVIACAVVLIIGSVIAMMMRKPKVPLDNSTSVVGLRTIDNYSQ